MTQATVKKNKYADDVKLSDNLDQLLEDFGFLPSAFKPGQFEATKKKLRGFIDDGDSPDNAVHKAVALCAPGLAKKHFRADSLGQRVGGNYEAVDHGNGFFSIKNIPIFAEVPPGAKRNKERIGEEWMDKAIEQNRMRRKEGHLPPVHIYHSDETAVKPSYAGKFVLTHRGTTTYEGREIPALFANIIDIPAEVFKRIKSGVLPYRSVEVHDWDNPEIDSLALMDTDVPFFRMAMTTIGKVKMAKDESALPVGFRHTMSTLVHLIRPHHEAGAAICFRFDDRKGGANMATGISNVKPGNVSKSGLKTNIKGAGPGQTGDGLTDQAPTSPDSVGPSSGTSTEDQDSMVGLDDSGPSETGNGSVDRNSAPGGTEEEQVHMDDSMGAPAAPAGDPMSEIKSMLQQILQALSGGGAGAAPAPAAPAQDLTPVAGMRAAAVEKIMLKAVLPLQMEVKKLQAEANKLRAHKQVNALVNRAKAELEGWPIDSEIEATLFKAAQGGYIDDVVELIKKSQPVDPPDSPAAFESSLAEMPEGGAVAKFMAENPGPKANEWVRMQAKEHAAHVERTGSDITLEAWLKTNRNYEATVDRMARPSVNTLRAIGVGR